MVADRLLGLIVMIVSMCLFGMTIRFPFQASVYPTSILVMIFFLGLSLMVKPQSRKTVSLPGLVREQLENKRVIAVTASVFLFIALIEPLGFYVALFLFVMGCQRIMGVRKVAPIVLASALMTALIYGIFSVGLRLSIPMGILEF